MNNKLIAAALAGIFATATPIATFAEEAAKAPEAAKNGCTGKAKAEEAKAKKDGKNGCTGKDGSAPAAPAPETK